MGKVITCEELVKLFEDVYCEQKEVIISIDCVCPIKLSSSNLEVYDTGNKIRLEDNTDFEIVIHKSNIINIFIQPCDISNEVVIDIGDYKISLVICSY
jgi:nucleosome binding factor SPN SPT16 subunit